MKLKLLFITIALFVVYGRSYGQTYNQITLTSELTNGDYLIVGDGGTTDGIMLNTITAGTPYINYTAVTNPGASITTGFTVANVFTINVSGGNVTIFNSNLGYVSWGRTGNTGNTATFFNGTAATTEQWTPTVASGLWTLANVNTAARLLQWNTASPRFAAYTSAQVKLKLYKLASSTPTLTAPTATTITTTTATLGANVTADGGAAITSRGTVWGTSAAPTGNAVAEGGTGISAYTHSRSGFTANTVYTYRGYAINIVGTAYSADANFTTLHNAPNIGSGSGAALNAFTANWAAPTGGGSAVFTYEIQVDDDSAFGSVNFTQSNISSGVLSTNVNTGLSTGTTYYYRVRAVNAGGYSAWSSTSVGYATIASTDEVNYANVQFPATGNINVGGAFNVYAQTYEPGVTEAAGPGTGIASWIGYSSSNTDPSSAGWTWVLASFNTQSGNNDEFVADIGAALPAGTYYYASRFQLNGGPYKYGGYNGGFFNGTTNVNGTLTVNPHLVDWANLQSPSTAAINQGATFTAYGQVYEPGVTNSSASQGAGITVDFGISPINSNTNPNTWTNWTSTTAIYNNSCGTSTCGDLDTNGIPDNDEYSATTGSVLTAGTYYYTFRYSLNGGPYMYGGYNAGGGGFWNGTTDVSGTLTITTPTIAISPSTLTGFTYVNGSGPSTNQTYTISGANLSADILLTAPTDYEICLTAGGTYSSSLSLTQSGGTVATTTIYVRLKAGLAVASYNSENIAATSTGATTKNVACSGSVTAAVSGCNELFISEYGEGSTGNSKYIEIYNPTSSAINLANYQLWGIANGGSWAESTYTLSGSLASFDVVVIANNSTDVPGADLYNIGISSFNGDDAVGLAYNGGSGTVFSLIDAVGTDGTDPGTGWAVAGTSNATVDSTLKRKATVQSPNTLWSSSAGTNTTDSEWEVLTYSLSYIGTHESICDPNPIITVSPIALTGFTYILATGPSTEQNFTASGTKLTANLVITPPTDYEVSTTSGSGFGSSITLTPTSGTVASTTIYVRLKAGLAAANYTSENIAATSAGATTKNVSCSGTVTQPTITSATTALSGFTYTVGAGPSTNQNFTVSGSNLSGNLVVTAPTNYEVCLTAGGTFVSSLSLTPTSGTVSATTIYIRLKSGLAINNYNESISITATNATTKTITLSGTVTGNLESDIITANGESATVSSLVNDATISTTADGTQVWQFTIRDGGSDLTDADNLQTIVNSIVFSQNPGNEINDWSDAIQAVALFNGTTKIADGVITTNQITFSGAPLISVPDNGSVTLTVRLSVQVNPNNTGGNLDGDDFVFNISNANVTTSATGSGFSAFTVANSINGQNVLSVVASKLVFTQQPTSTGIGSPMTTVKVSATDANGNVDLGFTGIVSITSTGTMTSSPQTVTASAGVASFSTIVHSVIGTARTLTATASGLTPATSSNFNINAVTIYSKGDFAVIGVNSNFFTCASAPYNAAPYQAGDDEVSFIVFKDIQNGDIFYITDNGYERTTAGLWGDTEGVYQVIRTGTTLPSGTVITFRLLNNATTIAESVSPDTNWSFTKVPGFTGNVVMNTGGDQLFFMQGGAWTNPAGTHDATYTPGTYLYGFNTNTTWQSLGSSTQKSGLPIELNCFNLLPGSASDFIEYTGPTTAAAKLDWITRLNNPSNWTDQGSCAGYTRTHVGQTYSVLTTGTYVDGVWTGSKSTDWFDCSNWQTLEVPDELVNVNVNSTYATKDAIVDATSTKAATYGSIAKCNNLTISSNKVQAEASTSNKLEVHGNVIINTTGTLDMDDSNASNADGQLYLYGKWTNSLTSAAFQEGNGTVHFLGSTPQIINNNIHTNPEEFYNVVLGNDFDTSISNNLIANGDLTVNAGKKVTVSTGDYLKIQNGLKNNGTVNINTDGSLVQVDDNGVNTGNITYERIVPVIRSTDYTYWSSPVLNQNLQTFSANTPSNKFYSFNAAAVPEDWKNEAPSSVSMDKGVGYCIYGPQMATPPAFFVASFIGKPNNGLIPVPIKFNGAVDGTSNLIGNPYPSAIDADKFLFVNKDVIEGTIYFWTHNTDLQLRAAIIASGATPGTGALAYTSDDYASYNSTGGTAGSGVSAISDPNHPIAGPDLGKIPNGKIAAGQAFFTTSVLASGSAIFNNSMRIDNLGKIMDNSQFFKTKNPTTKTATIEKHRIWLDLTNTQGIFKQTLIGYVTDATNEYDTRFDGISFDANEFADFYSISQDKNLVIQGRTLPFDENDQVPLGFRTTIEGAFTINIDQADGLLTNQAVFIEDKLTNTTFDLRSCPFTFNTAAGTFNDRFVLRYTNKTLGTNDFESLENQVLVSNKNKQIKVNSKAEIIDKVSVYDLLGRQLFKKDKVNSNEFSILNLVSSQQTLLVKVTLQNGQTLTRKIIY
jgi:hypothetical protein